MKKLTFLLLVFLILSYSALFSQSYFNTSNVTSVPLNASVCDVGYIYFGLEKISTNFLDIVVTSRQVYNSTDHRIGHWNLNNGNGEFGSFNSFTPQDLGNNLIDNIFVKLRSNSSVKDLIICRDDGLQVHWNNNGGITGMIYNYYGGTNLKNFETGIFDMDDNSEDILASNGTESLFYFKNNNDGSLSNYSYVDLPHSFTEFKIRQLNEKGEGYIQNNPDDRSDIIFLKRNPLSVYDKIYAYLNNNANGFNTTTPFAEIITDKPRIVALEVADLDGDGYNDIVVVCKDEDCNIQYNFRAYKNHLGQIVNNSPIWSFETNDPEPLYGCGDDIARINVADINKDGLYDLVFSLLSNNIIRFKVFINHSNTSTSWYASSPEQSFNIINNFEQGGFSPMKIMTADLYGGQGQLDDGGGIALLVSYSRILDPAIHLQDLHIDVFNATVKQTNPPPPILQRLVYYDQTNNIWHPWIHLDRRGERDFKRYDIYKYSPSHPLGIIHFGTEDDFIDYNECMDLTGGDNFFYNCYYYAKEVDIVDRVSEPSKYAYYTVGCIPSCDGCEGDNLISNPILNFKNSIPPEKFTLTQNYPNPFNPLTTISFTLPKDSKVKIIIYNSIGQQIEVLTNQYYNAGSYSLKFDGTKLPSGIYFYRILAGDYSESRRMILLK